MERGTTARAKQVREKEKDEARPARREVMQIPAHEPPRHAPFPDADAPVSGRGSPARERTILL